jgi:hypothetical protein
MEESEAAREHLSRPSDSQTFGTSPKDYRTWIDILYDRLGASPDRPAMNLLVSAGIGTLLWLVGLGIMAPAGLEPLYVSSFGVYVSTIGIGYALWGIRYVSQTVHGRNNALRYCFSIENDEFTAAVAPSMRAATTNRAIIVPSTVFMLFVWTYFAIVIFGSHQPGSFLLIGFPSAFPAEWRTGGALVPKALVLYLFTGVAIFVVYTGARYTVFLSQAYRQLTALPAVPLPSLVSEMCHGVNSISIFAAFSWSFGVVFGELLYGAKLDPLAILFLAWVISFGVVSFYVPHASIALIWEHAKAKALEIVGTTYATRKPVDLAPRHLIEVEQFVQATVHHRGAQLTASQTINLVLSQSLPLLPFAYQAALKLFKF